MDADAIRRSLSRIAHEIAERNRGTEGLVLAGVISKGDVLARRLVSRLTELEGVEIPVGVVDASGHRDDRRPRLPGRASQLPDLTDRTVILVDDVIHRGRTARAAMEALIEFGRPRAIQLAVLVDRGHRQLPIRPDYVGKNVPTAEAELVEVCLREVEGLDAVVIVGL
jgi:pyrimidine operon attenuation protein/uracil phosphoribosyltransferase